LQLKGNIKYIVKIKREKYSLMYNIAGATPTLCKQKTTHGCLKCGSTGPLGNNKKTGKRWIFKALGAKLNPVPVEGRVPHVKASYVEGCLAKTGRNSQIT
jgi:hypothetical protein